MVKIIVGSNIVVEKKNMPEEMLAELRRALTIRNKDKDFADKEFISNDLPENISLYKETTKDIILPRGITNEFFEEMNANNIPYDVSSQLSKPLIDTSYFNTIELRDHQVDAVEALSSCGQGIYKAPPGSGKTVTAIETIRRVSLKSIILVNTIQIADQWKDRIASFTGYEAGIIGDSEFDEKDITIALKQTLWSRKDELIRDGFFRRWGVVIYDECHHITADSYQFIVQLFNPTKLIGLSATPKRNDWTWPIAVSLLGPVIHKTEKPTLEGSNILMRPTLEIIPTDFNFEYRGSYLNKGGYRVSNNYGKMVKQLAIDKERNHLIASKINEIAYGRRILIVSDRLRHLFNIGKFINEKHYFLTGEESREQRAEVIEKISNEPGIILSTIANEALDIPELDTLVICYPSKGGTKLIQQIGRIERYSVGKNQPLIIDFYDRNVDILYNQFRKRMIVYNDEDLNS